MSVIAIVDSKAVSRPHRHQLGPARSQVATRVCAAAASEGVDSKVLQLGASAAFVYDADVPMLDAIHSLAGAAPWHFSAAAWVLCGEEYLDSALRALESAASEGVSGPQELAWSLMEHLALRPIIIVELDAGWRLAAAQSSLIETLSERLGACGLIVS